MVPPVPRAGVLSINAYIPGKSAAHHAGRTFKLSANESPLGPSPRALEAARAALTHVAFYPDGKSERLREAIGAHWGLEPARLIAGSGTDDILSLIAHAYIGPGEESVYSEHGFLFYKIITLAAGGTPVVAPEENYTTSVDALLSKVNARTKVVFVANPNNPTGTYLPASEMERLARELPSHVLLVLDAAYAEYVEPDDYEAGAAFVREFENVIMTRTFSKFFGLAGLRVGWAYAQEHIIDALDRIRSPFNVNSIASSAAIAALEDGGHQRSVAAHNATWAPWLNGEITALGLDIIPSVANFLAIRFPGEGGCTAAAAERFLESRGLILRGIAPFGMSDFLRLTVGSAEANQLVIAALKEFCNAHALKPVLTP